MVSISMKSYYVPLVYLILYIMSRNIAVAELLVWRLYHEQLQILPIILSNSWKEMQTMKKEIIVCKIIPIGSVNS